MWVFLKMKIKKDILKISREEYDKSVNNFVDNSKEMPFIKSVYLFGNIGSPGISDIDLFIVVSSKGNFEKIKKIILKNLRNSSKYSDYLYYHDPIIVTEKEAPYTKFFHTTKNLKLLYGNKINFKDIKNPLIEKLWNTFFYRTYLNEHKKNIVSERRLLLILNNLSESIRYNLSEKEGKKFKDKVERIRKEVLSGNNKSDSEKRLLDEGINILKKLEQNKFINKSSPKKIIWDKRRSFFIASNKLKLIDFKIIKIYLFPFYYFNERNNYKELISKFIKENNLGKEEFFVMRKKFQSPSFFGY